MQEAATDDPLRCMAVGMRYLTTPMLCFLCMQPIKTADYAPNRVLVRFRMTALSSSDEDSAPLGIRVISPGKREARVYAQEKAETYNVDEETVRYLERQVPVAFEIVDGMSVEEKVSQLNRRRDIAFAEPDYKVELFRVSSDTLLANQWHHAVINSNKAWDYTVGTPDVKVCVIDSGVNMNHPDIAGNIIKGWNVVPPGDNDQYPIPGSPEWANYNDTLGHGTHVAGLVGAIGDNKRGVSGLAWRPGLLTCRFITDNGAGYISDAITCIRLCQQEGADIYSNSWGGVGYSGILHDEIKKLNDENALFVVAAGNNNGLNLDSTPLYPASYQEDNVLTVGSTTSKDMISSFSNIGASTVHIAAPGSTIYSTTSDGNYGVMSGTSMAAPIVSGAAVLLKSFAASRGYPLTPAELRQIMMDTATKFSNGKLYTISGGRLNIFEAMRALSAKLKSATIPDVTEKVPKNPETIPTTDSDPLTTGGSTKTNSSVMCGTSVIKGRPASQSSVYKTYKASNANDGDCRGNARKYSSACAITDPQRSFPWWTSSMEKSATVESVTITTRSDCCSKTLAGAKIMIGDTPWTGSGDAKRFGLCGKVPMSYPRGAPVKVQCTTPTNGKYIAVYLPKKKAALSICEVDVALLDSPIKDQRDGCRTPSS